MDNYSTLYYNCYQKIKTDTNLISELQLQNNSLTKRYQKDGDTLEEACAKTLTVMIVLLKTVTKN